MHDSIVFHIGAIIYQIEYLASLIFLLLLPISIFFSLFFQFTAATRNGLIGLTVASPAGEENNTVFVSAQTLGQQTEDVTVAALDREQNYGHVTLGGAQVQTKSNQSGPQPELDIKFPAISFANRLNQNIGLTA